MNEQQQSEPPTATETTVPSYQINFDTYGLDFYNQSAADLEVSNISARNLSNIYPDQRFNSVDSSMVQRAVDIETPEGRPQNEQSVTQSQPRSTKKARKQEQGHRLAEFNRNRQAKEATRKRVSKAKRAGCIFPVSRVLAHLKQAFPNKRMSEGAAVYLTGVLEYLTSELLDLSGLEAQKVKRKTIQPRHLQLAINEDDELNKLLNGVMLARGGVTSFIHVELLPKKKGHAPVLSQKATKPAPAKRAVAKTPKKNVARKNVGQQQQAYDVESEEKADSTTQSDDEFVSEEQPAVPRNLVL
jgi:histone H2A